MAGDPGVGPGAIYECRACDTATLRGDRCPACGCTDLDLLTRGP